MADRKTALARAWHFPTSPRSPYKIQGELALLKEFDGQVWDNNTQLQFAEKLSSYSGFEGVVSKKETAFSARDRLRGPRILGLIQTPKRGSKNPILKFTDAGNEFLNTSENRLDLLFLRQISKIQFCSPLHNNKGFELMNIRPLTVMVKMLLRLDRLTKDEIAIFALTTTKGSDFDKTINAIRRYRSDLGAKKPGIERKQFKKKFFEQFVLQVYSSDIDRGHTKLREGGKDFVKTKLQTLRDYADSTIRYLRATGIFTVLPHGQSLTLTKARLDEAKHLLHVLGTEISISSPTEYADYIQNYLGDPNLPQLLLDDPTTQDKIFNSIFNEVVKTDEVYAKKSLKTYEDAETSNLRVNVIRGLEDRITEIQIKYEALKISEDREGNAKQIEEMFDDISDRNSDVVDRPLMYEWNTWRSMVLINDAINVQGNYHADADGNPVSTASGKLSDILCEYESFWLGVEVTLQSGMRQYEAEGEPITRHIGKLQKSVLAEADKRPVFGLFVAEKINEEVVSHLFTVASRVSQVYGGKVRIAPLNRSTFVEMMKSVAQSSDFSNKVFLNFFEEIFSDDHVKMGELDWLELVQNNAVQLGKSKNQTKH